MAPRATWKGHIKLSLVTIPAKLYNAVSSANKVRLNMLHKDCHQRIKQQQSCPEHGTLSRDDIVKGYEHEKGKYVVVDSDTLASIKLETTKTIEIVEFVDREQINRLYYNAPYFVAPDGPVAEEAFRVFREALRVSNKVAIARVVLSSHEQTVAIDPWENGLLLTTMHYGNEVRDCVSYFEDVSDKPVPDEQITLFNQLIESKVGQFDPSRFSDRYEEALVEVIKAKISGEEPAVVQEKEAEKVTDFMEALRMSLETPETTEKKAPEPSKAIRKKRVSKKKSAKKASA